MTESAFPVSPLAVGDNAPQFSVLGVLSSGEWQQFSTEETEKDLVIVFYPLDFSPLCSVQVPSFSANVQEFAERGAEVWCVSRDSIYAHREWTTQLGLQVPLIADMKMEVARAFGVVNADRGTAYRSVFVLRGGKVVFARVESEEVTPEDLGAEALLAAWPQ